MPSALLLVDPQCDFIDGALPVPGAAEAMDALAAWILQEPRHYEKIMASCDFHPLDHCSFARNGGPWPEHCVRETPGAAIWPVLAAALEKSGASLSILYKGQEAQREEYSIFRNPQARQSLELLLAGDFAVDVCGVAGDVCVLHTLADAVAAFGPRRFRVLARFSPSLDGGATLAGFCREAGVPMEA